MIKDRYEKMKEIVSVLDQMLDENLSRIKNKDVLLNQNDMETLINQLKVLV